MPDIFSRKNFLIAVSGLVLGFISFSLTHGFAGISTFARVSIPERVIEISGPDVTQKFISINELEPLDLTDKIDEGIRLLEKSEPLATEKYVNENICFQHGKIMRSFRKEISFAILDTKTREIFEKRCWFSKEDAGEQNIFIQGIDKLSVLLGLKSEKSEEDSINEELALVVNWWNNHNSDIEVKSLNPDDESGRYIIIANKYPMLNSYLAYPQDRTGKKYSDIVYVPYSSALHTPELIEEGRKFLNESVARAFSELRDAGIQSVSYPGKLVTDTISPVFVKNIFLTEQTDPSIVLTAEDGGLKVAERVLVRLGANKEKAYRYTYSSVGALGLGQIMPATYENTRKLYPTANLLKDKDIGRVDIINGIKATILVFDDHFASVLKKLNETGQGAKSLQKKNPSEIEEMRAAIYNGGPGKINSRTATISSAIPETVNFVAKFRKLRALKLFD